MADHKLLTDRMLKALEPAPPGKRAARMKKPANGCASYENRMI